MDKGGNADPISNSTLREIDGCVCASEELLSFVAMRSADSQYGKYLGRSESNKLEIRMRCCTKINNSYQKLAITF